MTVISPPAEVGMRVEDVDTPALLLDLGAFERNLDRMAETVGAMAGDGSRLRLRAHAKCHKSADIGRRQVARGAVGVCCQKVSEAEAMVAGGINNVLVSNQIVGRTKLIRLAALAHQAEWIGVCVDDPGNLQEVAEAARTMGAEINVLVEVDVGAARCGVPPGEQVLALAREVEGEDGVRFAGLQAYQGRAQHIRNHEERRQAAETAVAISRDMVEQLAAEGIACNIVSGAGTGTYHFEGASGVYTELQAGSYVFMDADYARNLNADGGFFDEFEHSLFIWVTVMSKPGENRVVVDAGLKAMAMDSGPPTVVGMPEASVDRVSDEHAIVDCGRGNAPFVLGDKLRLVPGHCDPTVNLYDWYVCCRDGRVEALWPVSARGALR